jgi:hypothetical protein
MRISSFMYRRSRKNSSNLVHAMTSTKQMIIQIRNLKNSEMDTAAPSGTYEAQDSPPEGALAEAAINEQEPLPRPPATPAPPLLPLPLPPLQKPVELPRGSELRRNMSTLSGVGDVPTREIVKMNHDEVQDRWTKHESKVQEFLRGREEINKRAAEGIYSLEPTVSAGTPVTVTGNGNGNGNIPLNTMSFELYWDRHCKVWGLRAIYSFYAGSLFLLLAIMVFMWAEFYDTYNSLSGAIISVVLIGVSVLTGAIIMIWLRFETLNLQKNGSPRGAASGAVTPLTGTGAAGFCLAAGGCVPRVSLGLPRNGSSFGDEFKQQ